MQIVQLGIRAHKSTASTVITGQTSHLGVVFKHTHPNMHIFHFLPMEAGWISWRTDAVASANSAHCRNACYNFHLCGPGNSFDLMLVVMSADEYQL